MSEGLADIPISGPSLAADDAVLLTVVSRTASGYVIPAYEALDRQAGTLAAALDAFGREPLKRGSRIRRRHSGLGGGGFPTLRPEGRQERFVYWPDVHGTGARQLRQMLARQDRSFLQPERLAEQSAAVQGLHALEALFIAARRR